MMPLTLEERRKAVGLVERDNPELAQRLRDALDEIGQQAAIAAMVAGSNELSKIATKAMELLERFIQAEERRTKTLETLMGHVFGPKGIVLGLATIGGSVLSAWLIGGGTIPVAP